VRVKRGARLQRGYLLQAKHRFGGLGRIPWRERPRISVSITLSNGKPDMIRTATGLSDLWNTFSARLRGAGETIPPLILRLIMGWEFWESGLEKLNGSNWFADIQKRFPFPFDRLPTDFSWQMSTWTEIIGAVLVWIGLGTRVAAFSLLFVTFVATAAVHWPDMWTMWGDLAKGYAIRDMGHGNFKLPLLFAVMLLPLVFNGAGKLSLDRLFSKWLGARRDIAPIDDPFAWSLAALVLALPFLMLMPKFGFALLAAALALAIVGHMRR
jgi:putative oxidoreductase